MQPPEKQYVIPMEFYSIKFTEVINTYSRKLNLVIDSTTHIHEVLRCVFGLEPREGILSGDFRDDLVTMGVPPLTAKTIILTLVRYLEHMLIDVLDEKAHYDNYSWVYDPSDILIVTSIEYENSSDKPQRALG